MLAPSVGHSQADGSGSAPQGVDWPGHLCSTVQPARELPRPAGDALRRGPPGGADRPSPEPIWDRGVLPGLALSGRQPLGADGGLLPRSAEGLSHRDGSDGAGRADGVLLQALGLFDAGRRSRRADALGQDLAVVEAAGRDAGTGGRSAVAAAGGGHRRPGGDVYGVVRFAAGAAAARRFARSAARFHATAAWKARARSRPPPRNARPHHDDSHETSAGHHEICTGGYCGRCLARRRVAGRREGGRKADHARGNCSACWGSATATSTA